MPKYINHVFKTLKNAMKLKTIIHVKACDYFFFCFVFQVN